MSEQKDRFAYSIDNSVELARDITSFGKKGERVVKNTVSDVKKRSVPIIRENILKFYGLQQKDLKDKSAATFTTKEKKSGGEISVGLVVRGRLLTMRRFGMTPKKATGFKKLGKKERFIAKIKGEGGGEFKTIQKVHKPYNITVEILKGHKKTFQSLGESRVYIQKPPSASFSVPWEITGDGKPQVLSSISVPQMIGKKNVNSGIIKEINSLYRKRFDHNYKRIIEK